MREALGSTLVVQNFFYGPPAKNGSKIKISKNEKLTPRLCPNFRKTPKRKKSDDLCLPLCAPKISDSFWGFAGP